MDSVPFDFCQRVCVQDVILREFWCRSSFDTISPRWNVAYQEHKQASKYYGLTIESNGVRERFCLVIQQKGMNITVANAVRFYDLSSGLNRYPKVEELLSIFRPLMNNISLSITDSFFTLAMLNDLPVNRINSVSLRFIRGEVEPVVLAVTELPNLRQLSIQRWTKSPSSRVVAAFENLLLSDKLSCFNVSNEVKFSASFFEDFMAKRLVSDKNAWHFLYVNSDVRHLHKEFQTSYYPGHAKMKLLTHNFLCSNFLKNVTTGYPLILRATKLEAPKEWNATPEFFERILPRIDYTVLYKTVQELKEHPETGYTFEHVQHLPVPVSKEWQAVDLSKDENENILKALGEALGVEVVEGELQCPESNRVFPISNGIPNMLANEDEIA